MCAYVKIQLWQTEIEPVNFADALFSKLSQAAANGWRQIDSNIATLHLFHIIWNEQTMDGT